VKPIYEAKAQALVDCPDLIIDFTGQKSSCLVLASNLVKSNAVAALALEKLSMPPQMAGSLVNKIGINMNKKTQIISISMKSSNPQEAAKIATVYSQAFKEVSKDIRKKTFDANINETNAVLASTEKDFINKSDAVERQKSDLSPSGKRELIRLTLEKDAAEKVYKEAYERQQYLKNYKERFEIKVNVFDEARVPPFPIYPNRPRNMLIALISGIIFGAVLSFKIVKKANPNAV